MCSSDLILWAETVYLLQSIGKVQCQIAQALTYLCLVAGMDIVHLIRLYKVVCRNHTTVRNQALGTELILFGANFNQSQENRYADYHHSPPSVGGGVPRGRGGR